MKYHRDLSLDIQPELTVDAAIDSAKQGMVKWYDGEAKDYTSTQSSLWIFDETLLRPSIRPANLVWRIEMVSAKAGAPIRELVLVDAKTGNVTFHINQVDTAWGADTTGEIILTKINTSSAKVEVPAVVDTTWYVTPTGNDANSCAVIDSPCLTINGAINKAALGDTIRVALGTYTGDGYEVLLINKTVTLSGGWDANFSTQSDTSVIDGQGVRSGIKISNLSNSNLSVFIDRFTIKNGYAPFLLGGGINNSGSNYLTLSNSILIGNTAELMGGGIYNLGGTITISNTTISGNSVGHIGWSSGGGGGGIFNEGGSVYFNNSTLSESYILGFFFGSGILNRGYFEANNSTISGNLGETIYNSGAMAFYNSTISDNRGEGIQNTVGNVILKNTIIANNGSGFSSDCSGVITSQGYNLIGRNSCTFTVAVGDNIGTNANPINPHLTLLQDNGGPTFTHALMAGSPAINAGDPATCPAIDQRGVARPVGARCDIGAYEGIIPWMPAPHVNTYIYDVYSSLPGNLLCDQTQPSCTNGSNPHADAAHKYAIGTYNFYADKYLRDSIDNNGMLIKSTVHYCSPSYPCPYTNAFWSGTQMVYGDAYGFPLADDVVAHELTHGVTEYESNLFYFYQSGAINESLSDVWGEYYDQTNGLGNDSGSVRWLMGEDVSGSTPIRSMSNPPAYSDPDKMSSTHYYEGDLDNGGVHTNSGVNNKAVFLMVDGGSFGGITVSAIGWDKTAAIYYEAQTHLLSSGADYSDLYYALQQACANLTGQLGITATDCHQVKSALDAVEMYAQPAVNFNPDAPVCASGYWAVPYFQDDMESGTGKWNMTGHWSLTSGYASSPAHMLYGDDYYASSDSAATMAAGVALPAASNIYLHFKHAFAFEYDPGGNYDGGVLEYSTQ